MSYAFTLVASLVVCFAAQALALRAVGGRTVKSESNFFSSMGRIQAGAYGNADAMMLGSSITGRLPDRAQGFRGWANMGCDGGSAMDALRAMDEGILPTAPLLIIEANSLQLALDHPSTEIGRAMQGKWFKIGMKIPALSAYARPSAFFYSKLLERRTGSFDLPPDEHLDVESIPELVPDSGQTRLTTRQDIIIREADGIIRRLRNKGCQSVLLWLPPARSGGSPPPPWIMEMARTCGMPYWDLGQEANPRKVNLTDQVHMDAPSAARTMRTIQSAFPHFQ